jgi:hypothetical protein
MHGLRLEEQEDGSADVTAPASATTPATATSAEAASPMGVATVPTWTTGREPGANRTEAGAAGTEARLESFRPASAAATTSARTARVTAVIWLLFHPGLLPGRPPVVPVPSVVLVVRATVMTVTDVCCAVGGTH